MGVLSGPFARARAMLAAIQAAMALPIGIDQQIALAGIGAYKSRGHGGKGNRMKRTVFSRTLRDRSKYTPSECFARGCR